MGVKSFFRGKTMGNKKRRLVVRTVILLVLVSALVYTLYANFTKDKNVAVEIGDQAPDFVLTDIDGQKHKLSDYKGQGVFLNFWGTWCPPCEKEMPYMNNQYAEYKEKGVQILAVNINESDLVVRNFRDKYDLDFPVLIDKTEQVKDAYGIAPVLPVTFLIDKDGKIVDEISYGMSEEQIQQHMERIKP